MRVGATGRAGASVTRVRVTGRDLVGAEGDGPEVGQKVPDWKEVTPNLQGARLTKVMETRMEALFPELQSRQDGVCVGLYLH